MTALWTIGELADATQGKTQGTWPDVTGISIDSRTIQPGDLFIALKGPSFDGHRFVTTAMEKGAAGVLVSELQESWPASLPLLQVPDTEIALQQLGIAARARSKARVIGVTGSVGKTSTRSILATALSALGQTHATSGNLNNHLGVPLTLARMPAATDFAVIEMGMNHAGEIAQLTRFARPHLAMITTVEAVHLEFFSGVEAIADAKSEIFEGVEPGGLGLVNGDNPHFARLSMKAKNAGIPLEYISAQRPAYGRLLAYHQQGWQGVISAEINAKKIEFRLGQPGEHMAFNAVMVLTAISLLGLDITPAAQALAGWGAVEGRGKPVPLRIGGKNITLIDDSYNASPASIRAALKLLRSAAGKARAIVALGDILELGESGPTLHQSLAPDIVAITPALVATAGPLMKSLHETLPGAMTRHHAPTALELMEPLVAQLQEGDWLLVKGSHGSGMWRLADALVAQYQTEKERA